MNNREKREKKLKKATQQGISQLIVRHLKYPHNDAAKLNKISYTIGVICYVCKPYDLPQKKQPIRVYPVNL